MRHPAHQSLGDKVLAIRLAVRPYTQSTICLFLTLPYLNLGIPSRLHFIPYSLLSTEQHSKSNILLKATVVYLSSSHVRVIQPPHLIDVTLSTHLSPTPIRGKKVTNKDTNFSRNLASLYFEYLTVPLIAPS